MSPQSFEKMMEELRTEYLATFPQKLLDIDAHLRALDFTRLRDDFHKLKGTGKTYGIPEISELCAVVEKICLNAVTDKSAAGSEAVRAALELLQKIVTCRKSGQVFPLAEAEGFTRIKAL